MFAGRVFHATDVLKERGGGVSSGLQEESVALASSVFRRGLREEAKGGRQFVSGSY